MTSKEYTEASNYEMLIRNAHNCHRGHKNGADLNYMKNLMSMERGETFAKHLGTYDKQMDKVKLYISRALVKLSQTKPYSKEEHFFAGLGEELNNLNSTAGLMVIVNSALERVIELKNN